jgi:hypothetical protein
MFLLGLDEEGQKKGLENGSFLKNEQRFSQ